ncbi:MAG: hypothetical protein GY698_16745, partial [Actinomycetia bacterium]|nr:hypothetical protein [Actinomycetes bacterium]
MSAAMEREIQALLAPKGLGMFAGVASQFIVDNDDLDADRLLGQIRGTDTYRTRFRGLLELQEKAARGEVAYVPTEFEVLQIERQMEAAAALHSFPPGFYDTVEDFQDMIGNNVSIAEFSRRAASAEQSAQAALSDPGILLELDRLYVDNGVDLVGGGLTAFFLDPERAPVDVERQFTAARLSSAAQRAGVGRLTAGQAEGLATAEQGEGQTLANLEELGTMGEVTGEFGRQGALTQDVLVAAAGGDLEAQGQIDRRRQERLAGFSGGGGFARTQEGFT